MNKRKFCGQYKLTSLDFFKFWCSTTLASFFISMPTGAAAITCQFNSISNQKAVGRRPLSLKRIPCANSKDWCNVHICSLARAARTRPKAIAVFTCATLATSKLGREFTQLVPCAKAINIAVQLSTVLVLVPYFDHLPDLVPYSFHGQRSFSWGRCDAVVYGS